MEDFTKEIKEHNLRKALEIEAMGNQENEDFTEAIDEVADTLNKSLEDGLIGREEYERDFDNLDQIIQKARPHKYIKREGTPGNYKYYYTLEEYKAAKGEAVDTTEGKKPKEKEKNQPKFELEQDFINAGFEPLKGAMLDGYTGVGKTPYGKNYKDFSVVYDESSEDLYIEFDSGYGEYLSINKDGVKELVYYETLEDFLNDMNSIFPKSGEIGSDTLEDYLGKDGLEKLDSVIGKYELYNHIDRGF